MKNRIFPFLIFTFLTLKSIFAIDTQTGVFATDVKTLSVKNPDNFMSPNVIRQGTSDRLFINFDIIGDQHEYLRYRLIHCNSDWQPSRLLESEFIEGFNEAEIDDYAYSSNTFIHYVNYNIEIPNPTLPIIASGNYLLQVYPESDPDFILLQARFSVTENSMGVKGNITSRTDKGYNNFYQQLYLSVDGATTSGLNPYQDVIVTIMQNNRPETLRTITHPMRVAGNSIIYEHDLNLIYDAGNEYRRFETVRTDYPGMHVDSVRFGGTNWHAYLREDEPRIDSDYIYDSTQHGRFLIDEYNSSDADLGADYVTVHFMLDAPSVIGGEVYVDGDFTLNKFNDFNKMKYDYNTGKYYLQMPLKQGSYNYQYVVLSSDGKGIPASAPIEGNKYETQNEYLVQVFLRTPGSRGDRLVGSETFVAR